MVPESGSDRQARALRRRTARGRRRRRRRAAAQPRAAGGAADVPAIRRSGPARRCGSSCARRAIRWRWRRRSASRFARSIRTCRSPTSMPLNEMVSRSVARPRFYTSLLTLFAAVALALSATGIFGVMSYTVAQQSKEIGIRMALGARTGDVLRGVVGRALTLAGIGVARRRRRGAGARRRHPKSVVRRRRCSIRSRWCR